MRSGLAEPLRPLLNRPMDEPSLAAMKFERGALEQLELESDDVVLAPPVERPPTEYLSIAMQIEHDAQAEPPEEAAPVARNVSLASLMLGTMVIAVCLGLGRVSIPAGIVAFLILVPAYIRTLSAIWYYRRRERQLGRQDIAAIFANSLVLALMGLVAGGVVFWFTAVVTGIAFVSAGREFVPTVVGTAAAFVTAVVLIHKVWPVSGE